MRYAIELTGTNQHKLDYFPDGVASLAIPTTLHDELSLLIWGAVFPEPTKDVGLCRHLPSSLQSLLPAALYLAGWGELTFRNVSSGEISVWPYEPSLDYEDMRLPPQHEQNPATLSRVWSGTGTNEAPQYHIVSILEHPLGYMRLRIKAAGPVSLSVDPAQFVTEEELKRVPEKYSFDWTRTRLLQELHR